MVRETGPIDHVQRNRLIELRDGTVAQTAVGVRELIDRRARLRLLPFRTIRVAYGNVQCFAVMR